MFNKIDKKMNEILCLNYSLILETNQIMLNLGIS